MSIRNCSLPVWLLALVFFALAGCDSRKRDHGSSAQDTSARPAPPSGEIAADKLPEGVTAFIQTNYPGYEMKKAASDPLCQGGDAIDVAVAKPGAPNLSLIFKTDGTFVQQEEDVPLTSAPEKVSNALRSQYADYSAGSQIEKLILADNTVQYLIDLTKGNTSKEVIFDADGTVVCEK